MFFYSYSQMSDRTKQMRTAWREANREYVREYMREYQRKAKEQKTGIPVKVRGPYKIDESRPRWTRTPKEESGFDSD